MPILNFTTKIDTWKKYWIEKALKNTLSNEEE